MSTRERKRDEQAENTKVERRSEWEQEDRKREASEKDTRNNGQKKRDAKRSDLAFSPGYSLFFPLCY